MVYMTSGFPTKSLESNIFSKAKEKMMINLVVCSVQLPSKCDTV